MTDPIDITDDGPADIAWMRSLAQEGASAPLGGGAILMAAGLIYGAASLVQWAAIVGLTPFSPRESNWIWVSATAVFLIFTLIDKLAWSSWSRVKTATNRAARAAWTGVGVGIFATIASMAAVAWRLGEPGAVVLWLLPSVIMVFYGLGWGVSAAMMRSSRLGWLAGASLLAAPLMAAMTGSPHLYLAYALALFALMALPGFLLMRAARAARSPAV